MSYEWMAETSARHWDFVIQEIHTHLAAHYIQSGQMNPPYALPEDRVGFLFSACNNCPHQSIHMAQPFHAADITCLSVRHMPCKMFHPLHESGLSSMCRLSYNSLLRQ